MLVAMASTKIGVFLGNSPLPAPPAPPLAGIWAVLHEIRSEYAQLLTAVFLLAAGAGPWSLDAIVARMGLRANSGFDRDHHVAAIEWPPELVIDESWILRDQDRRFGTTT